MHALDSESSKKLVVGELDLLPDEMVDGLEERGVRDRGSPRGQLARPPRSLTASTSPAAATTGSEASRPHHSLPRPLLAVAEDLEDLKDQIHVTLVHEIAHYFGIDDDELHDLGWG
jgi:predicted Zn-dependent protease with MMP-like domain